MCSASTVQGPVSVPVAVVAILVQLLRLEVVSVLAGPLSLRHLGLEVYPARHLGRDSAVSGLSGIRLVFRATVAGSCLLGPLTVTALFAVGLNNWHTGSRGTFLCDLL